MIQKIKFSECVKYMIKGPFGSDMKKSLYVPKGDNTYKVYIQGNAIQQDETLGEYYVSEEYFHKKLERFEVHPGDYIITCDGTLGKYLKLGDNIERGVISSSLLLLKLDEDKIYDKYFELLWEYSMLGYLASQARNACLIHLPSAKAIGEVEIELPPMDVQIDIANKAYAIKNICYNRVEEICMLDELIKARFVELFGDIKTNEFGWDKCTFKDVSIKITDGEHGTVPRVGEGEGYLYFMARNITKDGKIDLSEASYVPCEVHNKIYKRCNPETDDLLLVCVGATIGKCTLVPDSLGEFSMARSVALIKPNKEMITSNFLINLLRSEAIQNNIDHCSHAAAQAGLYTNMINSLEAFVPPMELQKEFDTFCKQVDKSKVVDIKAA